MNKPRSSGRRASPRVARPVSAATAVAARAAGRLARNDPREGKWPRVPTQTDLHSRTEYSRYDVAVDVGALTPLATSERSSYR